MKKHHYILVLAALIITIFSISSSCHKKKKYCTESVCRSVLQAKDFFLFKQGSWWVYEEENTHQRDSQFVYAYNNTSGYDFDMRVHSTLEDYDYHYWPKYAEGAIKECSESEPVSGKCIYIYRNKGKIGDYIGEGICFFVNYKLNDDLYVSNVYDVNNKLTLINEISSYPMDIDTFQNVVVFHENSSIIEHNQSTKHFFVKNIGLIRKELLDSNQVWNLVNYHIES